jgi:membrane-associated phospholipid phosphatase
MTFDLGLIESLREHRTPLATAFFQAFTFLGDLEGYVLVVAVVYAVWDKRLGFRLAVLALLSMCLNHGLKTLIANPRPFVAEGTWAQKWAVPAADAQELAREYSTPSGHAMAGASFYGFLCASVRSRAAKAAAIAAFLLMGLSRPYLGVHYVEDVVLGWAIGCAVAWLAVRFGGRAGAAWNRLALPLRAGLALAASGAVLLATRPLYAENPLGQPLPFVSYLGLLSGILVARPLELRQVNFEPRSATAPRKALRVVLAVALVIGTLAGLDALFARFAADDSLGGMLLRYVRYAAAGVVGLWLAPLLFVHLGLAGRAAAR